MNPSLETAAVVQGAGSRLRPVSPTRRECWDGGGRLPTAWTTRQMYRWFSRSQDSLCGKFSTLGVKRTGNMGRRRRIGEKPTGGNEDQQQDQHGEFHVLRLLSSMAR